MKEILVYRINDYPDCGGGLYIEYFDIRNANDLISNRINELVKFHGNKFILETTGTLHEKIYKPIEVVLRYERQ